MNSFAGSADGPADVEHEVIRGGEGLVRGWRDIVSVVSLSVSLCSLAEVVVLKAGDASGTVSRTLTPLPALRWAPGTMRRGDLRRLKGGLLMIVL